MNNYRIARPIALITTVIAVAVPGHAEPAGTEEASRRAPLSGYTFENNIAEYVIADSRIYEMARDLAKTKPKHPPDGGIFSLASTWAITYIESEGNAGPDNPRYRVSVKNVYTGRDDFAFTPTLMYLYEVTTRSGITHTRLIGGYYDSRLWSRLVATVCKQASIEKPKELSNDEQVAPRTTAYRSITGKLEFKQIAELAKSAKPANRPATDKPWVTVSVSAAVDVFGTEDKYEVEVFKTPGLMRLALSNGTIDQTSRDLGVVSDESVWKMLCERSRDDEVTPPTVVPQAK